MNERERANAVRWALEEARAARGVLVLDRPTFEGWLCYFRPVVLESFARSLRSGLDADFGRGFAFQTIRENRIELLIRDRAGLPSVSIEVRSKLDVWAVRYLEALVEQPPEDPERARLDRLARRCLAGRLAGAIAALAASACPHCRTLEDHAEFSKFVGGRAS